MNEREALAYINDYTWTASRPGLSRTQELLERAGRPDRKLRFVHVAGTNGKGSTATMIATVLTEAGYRTGLYISPHLSNFRERMCVDGKMISADEFAEITSFLAPLADGMEDHPSQFELSTVLALEFFARRGCDLVVLEVGMGGLLDSTNVIEHPEVCVITNIGLDHTEFLGNTLAEIATNKAGIFKSGASAICYDMRDDAPEAVAAVANRAESVGIPLTIADFHQLSVRPSSGEEVLNGQEFAYRGATYHLRLLGDHQSKNAAVAIEALHALRGHGWSIPEEAVVRGLEKTVWPARLELLSRDPIFLLDGGHNLQGAQAMRAFLSRWLGDRTEPDARRTWFLLSILKDKDIDGILPLLLPFAAGVVCMTPHSPRALDAALLAEKIRSFSVGTSAGLSNGCLETLPVEVCTEAPDAVARVCARASECGFPVVAFGSLYSAGFIREVFIPAEG